MITDSIIAYGDQLGAQMSTLANLLYLAESNNQQLVFYDEFSRFRRGFLFLDSFIPSAKIISVRRSSRIFSELYCRQFKRVARDGSYGYRRIYKTSRIAAFFDRCYAKFVRLYYRDFTRIVDLQNDVHAAESLFHLDPSLNYDIQSGFGTYQDWKSIESTVLNVFQFTDDIRHQAESWYSETITDSRKTVAVHFRLTDYLLMASLNLQDDYYANAIRHFSPDEYQLVIFSDDIQGCTETIARVGGNYKITFVDAHAAAVDMCIMSLCNHNIIANSSFSFWGAMLNTHSDKKVICPHDFVGGSSPENCYVNGNWYPESWEAL